MVTMRLAAFCVLASLVISSPPAAAQETTGGVTGTVKDSSGAVLPGVTVTLRGEQVMGAQIAVTDARGTYRFRGISPGQVELSFEFPGFTTIKHPGIRIEVGGVAEVNQTMQVGTLAEAVTVEASGAVVDTQSTRVSTTYDKDWIDKAPVQRRSFTDILASAPGVDPHGGTTGTQLTSFGSMEDQNKYQLDGIDLTATFHGQPTTLVRPNTDIFQEAEILSVGAPAEYGNVQGAVFNVVTRQGTNRFHGSAAYYHQGDALTGRNTTDEEDLGFPFERVHYRDFSTQLGGPIRRDRVWFFGAYRRLEDSSATLIPASQASSEKSDDYFGKANVQIAKDHSLQGTLSYQRFTEVQGASPDRAPETQLGVFEEIMAPGVAYTAVLGKTTVLEGRYAGFYTDHNRGTTDKGGRQFNTYFIDLDTGFEHGGIYGWYEWHADRTSVSAKLSHHATEFLNAGHDFRLGLQYNDAPATGLYSVNDTVYMRREGGDLFAYGYAYLPYKYGGTVKNWGAFLDDTVQVGDRLTVNFGLRYDRTHARAFAEPELDKQLQETGRVFQGVDFYTWNTLSPRVGMNLSLTGDDRTVLKAHYGRYYAGGTTGAFLQYAVPSVSPIYFGDYDLDTNRFLDLELSSASNTYEFDVNQKPPWTDQYVLGVERQLLEDLNVSATYIHKRSRDLPVWRDIGGAYNDLTYVDTVGEDASGQSFTVQQLVGPREDRYFKFTTYGDSRSDANVLSLTASKRMSSNWQLISSAVFTRGTSANIQGLSATLNWRNFGMNPNDFVFSDGLLQRDRFFVFKTQFLHTGLPWGLSFGANYSHSDGYPWARTVLVPETNMPQAIQAEPRRNEQRFPTIDQLDLRVEKVFRFAAARARFSLDVFNLFNDDAYQEFRSYVGTNPNYRKPRGFIRPRIAMLGAKLEF
jgi:outer membrane receptor protein involved in Fe transport